MVKLNFLILPILFASKTETSFLPEPPIEIFKRTISTNTFLDSFMSVFCTKCEPFSATCQNNLQNVQNIAETGHFDLRVFTNSTLNIYSASIIIDSVNGTY